MGDNDVNKLQPPRLFGRRKAPRATDAPAEDVPSREPAEVDDVAGPSPSDADATAEPVTEPMTEPMTATAPRVDDTAAYEPTAEEPILQEHIAPEPLLDSVLEPVLESAPEPVPAPTRRRGRLRSPGSPRPVRPPRLRLPRRRSRPAGMLLVALVGLIAGGVLAGLTWAFIQLNSGDGLTFVYVLLVFVAAVVVGAMLLAALAVRSRGTIAFLGTGIVSMIAVCVGSGPLETLGGAIGVIVGSAPAYVLSAWITARFIDGA
jgi:hypothetical protein